MIKNYFKIAWRNLAKNKAASFLNIGCLVIGFAACLLIFQYVSYEKSYDWFAEKADQIVRLRLDLQDEGKLTMQSATVFPGIPAMMQKEIPEIDNYCRLVDTRISWYKTEMIQNNIVLSNDERDVKALESNGYYADQSFVDMFSIPIVKGNPKSALDGPDKMILSESMEKKYFGQENAVGKSMTVREGGNTYHYEITGVFKDYPANSHLSFNYLISYKTFVNLVTQLGAPKWANPETSMSWYDFYVYLQLKPGTDQKQFESKVLAFSDRHMNTDEGRAHNSLRLLYSMPLKDIHLYSHYNEEAGVNGDGRSVSFLFLIAFLIVIIAWVNYTNLATARSLERAREVGVRKVLGALRKNLVGQFLTESFLQNFIALIVACSIAFCLASSFNRLMGKETTGLYLSRPYLEGFSCLFLGGAFISGIYPAFILSGYHPIVVLKGLFKNSLKGMAIRKGLIIGQFAISIILIAGTLIVYQQVDFMRNQELGADISQTLVLDGPSTQQDSAYVNNFQSFRNEILQINGAKSITASSGVMGKEIYMTNNAYLVNTKEKTAYTFYFLYVDNDYLSSYGLNFKAGRNFSNDAADKKTAVMNEAAVKLLGISSPDKVLNELIYNFQDSLKVIGVVGDYHQLGLNRDLLPIIFIPKPSANNFYSIKLQASATHTAIASIEKIWTAHFPTSPFSYFFLDETFNAQYKADEQFGKVFGLFSFLAILIACLGLLGLSAYNILQKTKEIGIRKVLGASIQNVVFILSKDFLILIMISFLLAIPVGWWVMYEWLQNFAFRVNIEWWVFAIAGLMTIVIALLTISFHAIRAAVANPVKSLRTE